MTLTRRELEDEARRWYRADDLDDHAFDAIERRWREREADEGRISGMHRQIEVHNPMLHGIAWWETRQRGSGQVVRPITDADLFNLSLLLDAGSPKPRRFHPDRLVGRWRLVGRGPFTTQIEPVTATDELVLHADGRVETVGARDRNGWTWAGHDLGGLKLLFYPPGEPLPRREVIAGLDERHLHLYEPGHVNLLQRWERDLR